MTTASGVFTSKDLEQLNQKFDTAHPKDILAWSQEILEEG